MPFLLFCSRINRKLFEEAECRLLKEPVSAVLTGRSCQKKRGLLSSAGKLQAGFPGGAGGQPRKQGGKGMDKLRDDQVEWYASEVRRLSSEAGHTIPSMVFSISRSSSTGSPMNCTSRAAMR